MKYDSLIIANIGRKYGLYGDLPFDFIREVNEAHEEKCLLDTIEMTEKYMKENGIK